MKNFLLFNTSFFGDTLLTSPLCRSLKEQYPDSRLFFVANKPFADAARYMQGVDEVMEYDKKGIHKGISGFWHFYKSVKPKLPPIDAAFIIYGNERNIILAKMLGAAKVYADNNGIAKILLTNGRIDYGQLRHVQDKNLFLGTLYTGGAFAALPMRYLPPPKAQEQAVAMLKKCGLTMADRLTALCTTSKKAVKDMPVEECARLVSLLRASGRVPILVGAGDTAENYCYKLHQLCGTQFVDLTGKTSIPVLAAVLKLCSGLISVDTGTLHLGLAVAVPTVAVYYINEPAHLAAWSPKAMYPHALMKGPDFSAAAMLNNLKKIEEGSHNE